MLRSRLSSTTIGSIGGFLVGAFTYIVIDQFREMVAHKAVEYSFVLLCALCAVSLAATLVMMSHVTELSKKLGFSVQYFRSESEDLLALTETIRLVKNLQPGSKVYIVNTFFGNLEDPPGGISAGLKKYFNELENKMKDIDYTRIIQTVIPPGAKLRGVVSNVYCDHCTRVISHGPWPERITRIVHVPVQYPLWFGILKNSNGENHIFWDLIEVLPDRRFKEIGTILARDPNEELIKHFKGWVYALLSRKDQMHVTLPQLVRAAADSPSLTSRPPAPPV
jgi:hypothetical protein